MEQKENKFAYNSVDKREYSFFQKIVFEKYHYIALIFLIPFVLGHLKGLPNQLFVGSAVNALLAMFAFRGKGKKVFLIALAPSIAVLLSGIVFGKLSIFLIYFIPFIWIGNFAYIYAIKFFGKNLKAVLGAGIIKSLLLFSVAFVLVSMNIVPEMFLFAMGAIQLATALTGGIFSNLIVRFAE